MKKNDLVRAVESSLALGLAAGVSVLGADGGHVVTRALLVAALVSAGRAALLALAARLKTDAEKL